MTVTDRGDIILLHHWTLIVIPIFICDNIWHLPWQDYDIVMLFSSVTTCGFPLLLYCGRCCCHTVTGLFGLWHILCHAWFRVIWFPNYDQTWLILNVTVRLSSVFIHSTVLHYIVLNYLARNSPQTLGSLQCIWSSFFWRTGTTK